jgi:hypothetical protein
VREFRSYHDAEAMAAFQIPSQGGGLCRFRGDRWLIALRVRLLNAPVASTKFPARAAILFIRKPTPTVPLNVRTAQPSGSFEQVLNKQTEVNRTEDMQQPL